MSERTAVAILASGDRESGGGGSTMDVFIRDVLERELPIDVVAVVCNNPPGTVGVYDKLDKINNHFGLKIPIFTINGRTHPGGKQTRGQTLDESAAIYDTINERGAEAVVCLGYMKPINGKLINKLGWRPEFAESDPVNQGIYFAWLLNNHPGILTQTKDTHGLGTQEKALELGLTETAYSLHVVSSGIDQGPVVDSYPVPIFASDAKNPQQLFDRVQQVEKQYTATAIAGFFARQREFIAALA